MTLGIAGAMVYEPPRGKVELEFGGRRTIEQCDETAGFTDIRRQHAHLIRGKLGAFFVTRGRSQ